MPARTNYLCPGSQPNLERIGPGANQNRRNVVYENNIDACIGQYPMPIFARRADYRLGPKTQEVSCELYRNRKLAIVGNRLCRCASWVHRSWIIDWTAGTPYFSYLFPSTA